MLLYFRKPLTLHSEVELAENKYIQQQKQRKYFSWEFDAFDYAKWSINLESIRKPKNENLFCVLEKWNKVKFVYINMKIVVFDIFFPQSYYFI